MTHDNLTYTARLRIDPFGAEETESSWSSTQVPVGSSVSEALEIMGAESGLTAEQLRVTLSGAPVPLGEVGDVHPAQGDVLSVEAVPGIFDPGSLRDTGNVFTGLGAASGLISKGFIPNAKGHAVLGNYPGLASAFGSVGTAFGIAGTVVSMIGPTRALLDRIFLGKRKPPPPPPPPRIDRDLAIRNPSTPHDPIPIVFGDRLITPHKAADDHTRLEVDNDAILTTILAWGLGPMQVDEDSIRIGTDPLDDLDVRSEEHDFLGSGTLDWGPREDEDIVDSDVEGTWQQFETDGTAQFIDLVFLAPEGIYAYWIHEEQRGSDQSPYRHQTYHYGTVTIRVDVWYRVRGTSTWTKTTRTLGTRGNRYRATVTIDGGEDLTKKGARLPLAEERYEVRVRKTTSVSGIAGRPNATSQTRMFLESFKSRVNQGSVDVTGVAMSKFEIFLKAGSGDSLDTLTARGGVIMPLYQKRRRRWPLDTPSNRADPTKFGRSANPADVYRFILLGGEISARPLSPSAVDDANLGEWWEMCDKEGFRYCREADRGETRQALMSEVATAGRALKRLSNGKWGVAINKPDTPTSHLVTTANCIPGSFRMNAAMPEFPHAFRIEFDDRRERWERAERIVYADGYGPLAIPAQNVKQATIVEDMVLAGVDDADAVYKLARYVLAAIRLRPWVISLDVDIDVASRVDLGDRLALQHDGALAGQIGCEVVSSTTSAQNAPVTYNPWVLNPGGTKQVYTPINFATYDAPSTPRYGLFNMGTNDTPPATGFGAGTDGRWIYDGAFASWQDGNTQYVLATYGNPSGSPSTGGKAVRRRTRASESSPWRAWESWSTDTAAHEARDANRVKGVPNRPALFQMHDDANGPAQSQDPVTSAGGGKGAWAILEDYPHDSAPQRQVLWQAYYGLRVWVRVVNGAVLGASTMTLSELVTFESGRTYAADLRQSDGTVVRVNVSPAETPSAYPHSTHTVAVDRATTAERGNMLVFGERSNVSYDCVVTEIKPSQSGAGGDGAALTLMPFAPATFTAADSIPTWVSNASPPVAPTHRGPAKPRIAGIVSNEAALERTLDGSAIPTMLVEWEQTPAPAGNNRVTAPAQAVIRYRRAGNPGDTGNETYTHLVADASDTHIRISGVIPSVRYEVGVRFRDAGRGVSYWATAYHVVEGLGAAPPPVTSFGMEVNGDTTTLDWVYDNWPSDLSDFQIRWTRETSVINWDTMQVMVTSLPKTARSKTLPTIPGGTYAIKPRDVTGRFSDTALFAKAPLSTRPPAKLAESKIESPGFPGTFDGTEVQDNNRLMLRRTTPITDDPRLDESFGDRTDEIEDWPYIFAGMNAEETVPVTGTYTTKTVDLGGLYTVLAEAAQESDPPVNLALDMEDIDPVSGAATMAGTPSDAVVEVHLEVSFATEDPASDAGRWSGWHALSNARITARWFRFRVRMTTNNEHITPSIKTLAFRLYASERVESGSNIQTSASADTTITFERAFELADIRPTFTIENALSGSEQVKVVSKSATGMVIKTIDADGDRTARLVDYVVIGHGEAAS